MIMFSVNSESDVSRKLGYWRCGEGGELEGCDGWREFVDSGVR